MKLLTVIVLCTILKNIVKEFQEKFEACQEYCQDVLGVRLAAISLNSQTWYGEVCGASH